MTYKKPCIVVADDYPAMLDTVAGLLRRNDCDVVAAVEDGALAVQAAVEFRPDVVILDISMPRLNGIAAGLEIKKRGLPSKIIFLTVQSDAEFVEAARSIGAGFVLKGRLYSDLLPAVEELLVDEFQIRQPVTSLS
jgi:DNA-binding NarL/FixJ family response regulator